MLLTGITIKMIFSRKQNKLIRSKEMSAVEKKITTSLLQWTPHDKKEIILEIVPDLKNCHKNVNNGHSVKICI